MTDDKIALRTLLEKGSDATFLREMIGFAAQRLMELESDGLCGAAHGERSAERVNGSRLLICEQIHASGPPGPPAICSSVLTPTLASRGGPCRGCRWAWQ